MKKATAIIKQDNQQMQFNAESLISQAITNNTPVETMEKLLAMRRELKAEFAKEAYDNALAAFQKECPTIAKTKEVKEKNSNAVRYRYAPLDSIVEQTKSLLAKHGFSYSINTIQDEKMLGVVCRATHKMGHSEETKFSVPIGAEQYMSDVQKYGARLTFAKRYAFCNAFGILTGDEDNDALPAPGEEKKSSYKKPFSGSPENGDGQTKHTASIKQINYIKKLLNEKGYTEKQLMVKYDISEFKELTSDQASTVIDRLMKLPPKKTGISAVDKEWKKEEPEVEPDVPEIDIDEVDKAISQMQPNDKAEQDPAIIGPH